MSIDQRIEISVIVPVYNAGKFVTQAVESALAQPETKEVLLIEDGSPDNSLDVCISLVEKYNNVKLYRHENGKNKGAAASRNLGIRKATCSFVAFLDADDFFLPNRFVKAVEIFNSEFGVDGVYEAIGSSYEDDNSRDLFISLGFREITTVTRDVLPEDLFRAFMKGGTGGYYSIIGFTARKQVFFDVAFFDDRLKMYEDTMLMFQLSAKRRLFPGNITSPVALRRVHKSNRITHRFSDRKKTYNTMLEFWDAFADWSNQNLSNMQKRWVYEHIITYIRNASLPELSTWNNFVLSRNNMFKFAIKNPGIFKEYFFWRYLIPPLRENIRIWKLK